MLLLSARKELNMLEHNIVRNPALDMNTLIVLIDPDKRINPGTDSETGGPTDG